MPWLRKIAEEIDGWRARGVCGVLTRSALKRSSRGHHHRRPPRRGAGLPQRITLSDPPAHGCAARALHAVALLDSQFATLEKPTPDEHPIIVDVGGKPAEIAHEIVRRLEERQHETDGRAPSGEVAMLGYLLRNRKVWGLTIGFAAYGYSFYLFLT
jgi:gluconate kinase